MSLRIIFSLAVFLLTVFGSWPLSFSAAAAGQIIFGNYYELLFAAFWIDAVEWNGAFHSVPFFFSISAVILFLAIRKIRTYVNF